jgi:hypothetical protein
MESPKISLAEQQLASVSNNPASYDSGKVRNNCQPSDAASKLGLSKQPVMPRREHLHQDVADGLDLRIDQHGKAVVAMHNAGNPYALYVGTHSLNVLLREVAVQAGLKPRNGDIAEFSNYLQSRAESVNRVTHVSYRVASSDAGIVLDLGDAKHTRVSITAGKVEVITSGSETLFYRPSTSRPMAMPAEVGNLALLDKYLNLQPESKMLIKAWLSYTLATPKLPTSNYVILVLSGTQGSGKTSLSKNVILGLIDPSAVGVQMFPSNKQDFAIAAQNAHVLCYDNLREFKHSMADLLCVASTGGSISTRQLYTNADQQVHTLHVALVLNGIHSFIDQPDLSQRTLMLEMLAFVEAQRKSEVEIAREFEADLPAIQRGLFDLISNIMLHLPTAEVTNPERMIDFVRWLAAYEQADGVPPGIYQASYSAALCQGQRDSLLDNPLAAAILEFAEEGMGESWSGTPTELLTKLNSMISLSAQRAREWPSCPISLSKRLAPLQAPLLSQGIRAELTRGKHRTITISKTLTENRNTF